MFLSARPVLSVSDMETSLKFYTEVLGFRIQAAEPRDPIQARSQGDTTPSWVELRRDQVTVALYDGGVHAVPARPGLCALFVDDIETLAAGLIETAVEFAWPLRTTEDKRYRDIGVKDPDQNFLILSQELS